MQTTNVTLNAVGKDRPGIVARLSDFFYKNKGNILEDESYKFTPDLFGSHMKVEWKPDDFDAKEIKKSLADLCSELGMRHKLLIEGDSEIKRVVMLVTKEPNCPKAILDYQKELGVNVTRIIGTSNELKPLADEHGIEFNLVDIPDRLTHDQKIMEFLEIDQPNFIIAARYIRMIMHPVLLWENRNNIINIHPSILPQFKGAAAYKQAWAAGVMVHGSTAHLINEEMDEGPYLWQESYSRFPGDDLTSFENKGKSIEAKTLLLGVYLFANSIVYVRKDKVSFKKGWQKDSDSKFRVLENAIRTE